MAAQISSLELPSASTHIEPCSATPGTLWLSPDAMMPMGMPRSSPRSKQVSPVRGPMWTWRFIGMGP